MSATELTRAERLELFGQVLAVLLPLKITRTPPAKDGSQKTTGWSFASVCWASRIVRDADAVLAKDFSSAAPGAPPAANEESDATPF